MTSSADHRAAPVPAIAVLGPWRGGTSLVTGVLEALGVDVGGPFFKGHTGYPTWEDLDLRARCLSCFGENEHDWGLRGDRDRRVATLAAWIEHRRSRVPANGASAVGGKHPVMCGLVDELAEAWAVPQQSASPSSVIFISVVRDEQAIHESWNRPATSGGPAWWPRSDQRRAVSDLIRRRDESLRSHRHVIVDFDRLRQDSAAVINELAAACGLPADKIPIAIKRVVAPERLRDRQVGRDG